MQTSGACPVKCEARAYFRGVQVLAPCDEGAYRVQVLAPLGLQQRLVGRNTPTGLALFSHEKY
jgi:hypothetical protein